MGESGGKWGIGGSGPNTVQGIVTFVRDLGPVRGIHLDTAIGKLVAEHGSDHSISPKVGETVSLTLPPEALRLYPRQLSLQADIATQLAAE